MKKKFIISIFVILFLIIVAGGGFFWWQKNRETPIEKWEAAKVSLEEDYIAKETPEGKIVENKKMGLIYEIPKDWILENGNPTRFYSPDTEFKEKSSIFLENGCKMYVYTNYIKTDIDTLKNYNDANFSKLSSVIKLDESSVIKISNYVALRYKYHAKNFEMSYIGIGIPSKDKLYEIEISNPTNEMEHCEAEFNKFLETVSIK